MGWDDHFVRPSQRVVKRKPLHRADVTMQNNNRWSFAAPCHMQIGPTRGYDAVLPVYRRHTLAPEALWTTVRRLGGARKSHRESPWGRCHTDYYLIAGA